MERPVPPPELLDFIVDRVSVGVLVVDRDMNVVLWNRFMETNSGRSAAEVVGQNLFKSFPELPATWLERKITNVFVIKNFSFTSWEQRPYLFHFRHNRPVTGGIDAMNQNCTFLPVKDANDEVVYVCITLFDVTDTSISQSMLRNALRSLADASNRDGLTGVYNRRYLEHLLNQEFSRAQRYGNMISLIMLDIDHFKNVNDTHGHLAGDDVLRNTARRLRGCLRDIDTFARYGGEEFAVVLPETPLEGALIVAERLCHAMGSHPVTFGDLALPVTISLGVSQLVPGIPRYEELIRRADTALYQSKFAGRNRVTVYCEENTSSTEAPE